MVVFDIGGVMADLARGWEACCTCAGIAYRQFEFTPAAEDEFLLLERAFECGCLGDRAFATRVSCLTGGRYTPEEIRTLYFAVIREEFPGVADIVQALKAAGVRTGCFSNTCALHWPALIDPARYPAIAALDEQQASHLLGVRKPDAEGFLRFCQATGAAPASILFFDDRPENVAGARAFGWQAVQITPDQSPAAQIRMALERYHIL